MRAMDDGGMQDYRTARLHRFALHLFGYLVAFGLGLACGAIIVAGSCK